MTNRWAIALTPSARIPDLAGVATIARRFGTGQAGRAPRVFNRLAGGWLCVTVDQPKRAVGAMA